MSPPRPKTQLVSRMESHRWPFYRLGLSTNLPTMETLQSDNCALCERANFSTLEVCIPTNRPKQQMVERL